MRFSLHEDRKSGRFWCSSRGCRTELVESQLDRARRLCGACGLTDDRTDQLVKDVRFSGASRETAVMLWEETYVDPAILEEARELCGGCVKAVVDATAQETP